MFGCSIQTFLFCLDCFAETVVGASSYVVQGDYINVDEFISIDDFCIVISILKRYIFKVFQYGRVSSIIRALLLKNMVAFFIMKD